MEGVKIYNLKDVQKIIKSREGEIKFGERVQFIQDLEDLATIDAKYVLFGIPEDIGIRGNLGKAGAAGAWKCCLNSLLNIQANQYTKPEKVILLGEVDCSNAMQKASNIDVADPNYHLKLGDLIGKIDEVVSRMVTKIISAGKIPIIIGGGHNNAYGNMKGTSEALKKSVNILNIDAHTDLRKTEYRHSGNGFSYARKENFLGKYRIFGLHQNYTPQYIFENMLHSANDGFRLFEHLILMPSEKIVQAFREELEFVSHDNFGLELDCDAIKGFPSSAQTPSGFAINMIRNFISIASEEEHINYLHICEAAPTEATENKVGKALSYFITDFIR
ncbi:formiminoglutamase [Gillisia sp. Hel_I_86]|uniref:arginase family protein n=1 Tax=Gillisia sp. Hel_I_86 TaxID=1249981 RepID=UPI00119B73BA|nr:arginase family protein [Gillisia sp. Hel_I_86]TVZ28022.1 formiminoglutamase [Gillisia sp. Hel_I_86]